MRSITSKYIRAGKAPRTGSPPQGPTISLIRSTRHQPGDVSAHRNLCHLNGEPTGTCPTVLVLPTFQGHIPVWIQQFRGCPGRLARAQIRPAEERLESQSVRSDARTSMPTQTCLPIRVAPAPPQIRRPVKIVHPISRHASSAASAAYCGAKLTYCPDPERFEPWGPLYSESQYVSVSRSLRQGVRISG